ncbi:hypothetical protein [Spirosoma oryzicola]|uniref:hypothetical protein n=1 Tax=Spirosoma oryzicola TaxID=2898794 RepID=UPI001E30169E|nr:hypothetical protein [Spirosoma oryzicola]UHG93285.1 hypothetical protein LQ777_10370 [Spirosoma oryzicola]
MWIVIAQFICLAAAIGLLAIMYDLDHATPWYVRYGLLALSVAFIGAFGASFRNPSVYEHAAAIAFTGVGVMVIAIVFYLVAAKTIKPGVLKVSGGAFLIAALLWTVGSCSDIKRQQLQMEHSTDTTRVQSDTSTHY